MRLGSEVARGTRQKLDDVLQTPSDIVTHPVVREPIWTGFNAKDRHRNGMRRAELRRPHVFRSHGAEWRFANDWRCRDNQLYVLAGRSINSRHCEDVAARLHAALDKPCLKPILNIS